MLLTQWGGSGGEPTKGRRDGETLVGWKHRRWCLEILHDKGNRENTITEGSPIWSGLAIWAWRSGANLEQLSDLAIWSGGSGAVDEDEDTEGKNGRGSGDGCYSGRG
ncbi:hypothetical protein LR48_Vigan07g210500 [Vigna angularis]|uniref:Uncharacterized protein n=1 Tax=Phaseolus angularis TaxID=3914 RepID=A0A0L9V0B8_PHAAN|nr:hypothetical protein LR48_Vigan07g210500 [Vigna angularis]